MTKRIPIRAKLALALFVPVLAMFAVSIYEVGVANRQVAQVRDDTDLAGAALGPGGLIRSLQDERNDSAISAVGLRASAQLPTDDLDESRALTDAAAVAFRQTLADSGDQAAAVYAPALASLERSLAKARAVYDDATGTPGLDRLPLSNELWSLYTRPIDDFVSANTRLTLLVDDPELRSSVEMLDALTRQFEDLGTMVRTGIISSLGGDKVTGTTKNDVIKSINRFEANEDRITLLATGSYASEATGLEDNAAYDEAIDLLEAYLETDTLDTAGIIAAVSARPTPNLDSVTTATTSALASRSATLRDDAQDRQRTFIALALGVLLVGGGFMIAAARSITRPLRSLTRQAEDMASTRLPAAVQQILDTPVGDDVVIPEVVPVTVKTRDEVREVAQALNAVQSSAIDLAVEQAVLRRNIADSFVNLGRRTQNLIGRQLAFISDLERNETDPATLDDLFKLDHLATRARRNAESLVVLAGLATPRTWSAPIAMGDVIRAALSEVEDYQRVEIRAVGDAMVPGNTAADLVHLLAELVENGLSFSPPGRPVEIYGRMTRNGYVLAVIDHGIGMTGSEVERANRRLAGTESYTVAPSRYLGHHVAGSLASRIGVSVQLDESPTGGIAAKIAIPSEVLAEAPAMAALSPGSAPPALAPPAPAAPAEAVPAAPADATEVTGAESAPAPVAPATSGPSAREHAVATTEHGLRKRIRRGAPEATTPLDAPPAPIVEAAPAAAPAAAPPSAPVAPVTPAPVAAEAPGEDPWVALLAASPPWPETPVPGTVAATSPPAAATPPTPTRAEAEEAGLWSALPPAPAPAPPAPVAEAAPAVGTTTNGLRKRVPGDQLAASTLTPIVRRTPSPADGAPPAPIPAPAADGSRPGQADGLFALLNTFESGVQRGRDDYARAAASPADPVPTDGSDPVVPTDQEV